MKTTALSLLMTLALASVAAPVAAQDEESAEPVHTCIRVAAALPVDDLEAAALGQMLIDGLATFEVLSPEECQPMAETAADESAPYIEFVAHSAGAAIALAALAEKSANAEGLTGLDRSAKRLVRWSRRQLEWLDRHDPEPCYVDVHSQWRRGVVKVRDGAKDVRESIRTLRPAPMRRAVRSLASGAQDLTDVDLGAVTRECAST